MKNLTITFISNYLYYVSKHNGSKKKLQLYTFQSKKILNTFFFSFVYGFHVFSTEAVPKLSSSVEVA